jgi:two-component system sensor histidine kinase CpxA
MRSLFLKIFLWFWLTVVLLSSILVVITAITHSRSQESEWQNDALVAAVAARAVDIYERDGTAALGRHLQQLLPKRPMQAYLLDDHGTEVLGQKLPEQAIQLASKPSESSVPSILMGPLVQAGELNRPLSYAPIGGTGAGEQPVGVVPAGKAPVAAGNPARVPVRVQPVIGASGRRYTAIVVIPPLSARTLLAWVGVECVLRVFALVILTGIFCLWLARHITAPVVQLRQAANKLATGDFSARACAGMPRRRDEIGLLGQQFDRMAERIESLLADHERLLSTVSHELRSPLTRLSVAAGLLRQCPEEEKLEYVNRIELETEQLNKLIAQLLTLSRIESGVDANLRKQTVDLANLLHEVAADGDFEARARSCSVSVGAVDPCAATGIVDQIRRAIENVVRNAIRHTKPNSEVEITLRRRGVPPNGTAVVRVRDHGPGVADSELEKIFQPFYRVVSPDGSNSEGSGLGLAITERIARTHGGTVRAVNAPDGGLLVELELPLNT